MTPLIDTAFLTVYSPATRGAALLALEATVLIAAGLTLAHALRQPDRGARFTWAAIFVYGVALEILSYHAFPNFTHGQFTVMLYHQKLPLYVTAVYPVLLYTSFAAVRRLGLSDLARPIVTGLAIVALDVPFDILGPDCGFWRWDPSDPNVGHRWLGVPVTSYYWHLTWGAILCALCHAVWPRIAARSARLRLGALLLTTAATMALGRAAFLPFDLLCPLGVSQGVIAAAAVAAAAAVLLLAKQQLQPRDGLITVAAALFAGLHAVLAVSRYRGVDARVVSISAALLVVAALHRFVPAPGFLRRTAPPPPAPAPRAAATPSSTTTSAPRTH